MTAQSPIIRRQWAAMLAKLVAPMDSAAAGKALADMLPMFADLPDAAFTTASLEDVATQHRRVPTYSELRASLGGWWLRQRPPAPAIAAPPADWRERYNIPKPRDPPTEAEAEYVGGIIQAFRKERAAVAVSRAIAGPARPVRPPKQLSDTQLLATVERTEPNGVRAQMLRAKIAAGTPA